MEHKFPKLKGQNKNEKLLLYNFKVFNLSIASFRYRKILYCDIILRCSNEAILQHKVNYKLAE